MGVILPQKAAVLTLIVVFAGQSGSAPSFVSIRIST
jgi:hypothetical protein